MNGPKKRFEDSRWYTVVFFIVAVLLIYMPVLLLLFFGFYLWFFVIVLNARTLGPWWIVLSALLVIFLAGCFSFLMYFRSRRETRFAVGDEMFFITQDKLLPVELWFERVRRTLREKITRCSIPKSERERFLERCYERRREMQKNRE